jgi:SAM domain (Sterile alpha motif)
MDVTVWLQNLGLQQYETLFRENDIDAEAVGDLTDADLEKLGVTLGHRKRLLKRPQRRRASGGRPSPSASVKRLRRSSSKNELWLWRFCVLLKRPLAFKFHPHERLVDNPIHRKIV